MKNPELLFFLLIIILLGWIEAQHGSNTVFADPPEEVFLVTKFSDDNGACEPDDCSLREAIIAAADLSTPAAIDLPPGTYTLTLEGDDDTGLAGDLDILNPITITGNDMNNTIIDASAISDRVFHVINGAVSFNDLTIANGGAASGGGILHDADSVVTINRVIFDGNTAHDTGGAILNNGTMTIDSSVFKGNSANNSGGGISNLGFATITNCLFSENSTGSNGGGIYNSDTLFIENSALDSNQAENGSGGGIYQSCVSDCKITVSSSTISRNLADDSGGGVFKNSGSVSFSNSTISNNTSSVSGGGISNFGTGDVYLVSSTLSDNSAAVGAGIKTWDLSELNFTNTIIANSLIGEDCVSTGIISINEHNLVEDNSCSPQFSGDPDLKPLGNNGGPTETHALNSGSLAIDNGDPLACSFHDQRGYPRVGICDIGSYEYGSKLVESYLPAVLNNYINYFDGSWEVEPNNSYTEANGPLRSGQDYFGYPNDQKDYFSFLMLQNGDITIDLTGHTGSGVQLQLFYESITNRVDYDSQPPYQISLSNQPAGTYYVYIFTESGFNTTNAYTLHADYPAAP